MPNEKIHKNRDEAVVETLTPLPDSLQLGGRVYKVLANSIVSGKVASGSQLRPDVIARQLDVSTTPVREAMHRLESDGLLVKVPYQGWYVREFTEKEIRELYEFRAALERFSIRLACNLITPQDVRWMRKHQLAGKAALKSKNMEQYRVYNRDFHQTILRIAGNSYLMSAMAQVALQSEMLSAKTISISGRPLKAVEEHAKLIDLMEHRRTGEAEKSIELHIMTALEAILSADVAVPLTRTHRANGILALDKEQAS
jgi:DNA-binding GntR family transcriptional regulator